MSKLAELANNTNEKWWKDPSMRTGVLHMAILYTAVYSLGYDGSLLNGIQALRSWNRDFDNPRGYTLGLIAASYYLPKIVAPIPIAWMNERFGRRVGLLIGAVFMLGGAILGGFSQNRGQLIGSRVLVGVGTVTGQITASAMIPELAHPRLRHWCGSFFFCTFYIGSIFAAWLTFAMVYYPNDAALSWRIPTFVQGFGPALLLFCVFLPESPRWLMMRGREEEAHAILAKYHANGLMDDEMVMREVSDIREALVLERSKNNGTWLDLVRTPSNRRRTAIVVMLSSATQFVGNGVVQYFLVPVLRQVGITKPEQSAGINGGLAVFNFIASLAGASLVERVGRRKLILTSFAGMLSCFVVITALSGAYATTHKESVGLGIVPFIFCFMGFYSIALTPLPFLYVPEISPLSLRVKMLSLFLTTSNLCLTFNNFVNPIALAAIAWKYYFVWLACLVGYGTFFFFKLRETRGLTVEEAALVYEDAEVRAAMSASREEAAEPVLSDVDDKQSVHEEEYKA